MLPAGCRFSTLDLSVRFIKPIRIDTGTVTSTGTVIHAGRNIALAEARLEDTAGTLLATATADLRFPVGRRGQSGQRIQVISFRVRELQGAGKGGDDLRRRGGGPSLLQPYDVVD